MNQKINEFAKQAGLHVDPDGEIGPAYMGSVDAGYRKFAELIVRECIAVHEDDYGVDIIGDVLKEHFGVEE